MVTFGSAAIFSGRSAVESTTSAVVCRLMIILTSPLSCGPTWL